ncbi:hypothetical protein VTO42DRAFT_774 [Malbranchea cinnamomea]
MPRRSAISNAQKAALHAQRRLHQNALNKDLQLWISEILSLIQLQSSNHPYLIQSGDDLSAGLSLKRPCTSGYDELEAAVRAINDSPFPLQNTRVIWLPANTTSRYQPLDQGIIPIRWGVQAWEVYLKMETIQKCFQKAPKDPEIDETDSGIYSEITRDFAQLQLSSHIHNLMDTDQFLDSKGEVVKDVIERLDEQILAQFGSEIEAESDETEVLPKIPNADALEAFKKLRLYEEQQDSGDRGFIQALNRHERAY